MNKQELRDRLNVFRKKLLQSTVLEKSDRVINNLLTLKEYRKAERVLYYLSMDFEVNTLDLIEKELKDD